MQQHAVNDKVILGLWPIAGITSGGVTEKDSLDTIRQALDVGIRSFDTAFSYGYDGESDRMLGMSVQGKREQVRIVGKAGQRWNAQRERIVDCTPETLTADAENSLHRMNVDHFDLFMLHAVDPNVDIRVSAKAVVDLQTRGLTKRIGVCNVNLDQLDAWEVNRRDLGERILRAYCQMVFADGFFHADPHPGNVFYLPGNRLAFIDFGMVGRLSSRRREELLQLLLGLVERRPQEVADVLLDWTRHAHVSQEPQLEDEIERFVDQHHGTPLAQLNLAHMLAEVTTILREHRLALPSDLALLIKAFVTLEGMGRGLDPGFHMATEVQPLLRQMVRARYRPQALAVRSFDALHTTATALAQLPQNLSRLLRRASRGHVQVSIDIAHLKRTGDQLDRAASRVSLALIIAALIIGSSIVMTVRAGPTLFGLPAFGLLGFVGAAAGGLWLLRSIWRGGRSDDDEA